MKQTSSLAAAISFLAWSTLATAQPSLPAAGGVVVPADAPLPQPAATIGEGSTSVHVSITVPSPPPALASPAVSPLSAASASPSVSPPAAIIPPYSSPWALRGIVPGNSVRLDTSIAFYNYYQNGTAVGFGQSAALMPSVSYKLTKNLVGIWRWGLVGNNAPDQTNLAGAASVANMMLGALYGVKLPVGFRLGFFLGATVPMGTGGAGNAAANTGDPSATEATARALAAREGMDNVIWGPNDFAIVPGLDFAYIGHRLTIQVEITIQQAMRVKMRPPRSMPPRPTLLTGCTSVTT